MMRCHVLRTTHHALAIASPLRTSADVYRHLEYLHQTNKEHDMPAILPNPRRVLAVMAHPDDVEFMAGGLVSRWAREGVELHYCLLTDGNSGSRDAAMTAEALATLRRDEQRAAGALLGVAGYTFLGHTDGRLVATVD